MGYLAAAERLAAVLYNYVGVRLEDRNDLFFCRHRLSLENPAFGPRGSSAENASKFDTNRDRGEGAGMHHGRLDARSVCRASQLAKGIVSPTVNLSSRGQRARVRSPRGDCPKAAEATNLDRQSRIDGRSIPQLSVSVESPAVADASRDERTTVVASGTDRYGGADLGNRNGHRRIGRDLTAELAKVVETPAPH